MTNEDVPPDVHDVLWTAYRDAGGNMDAGAVTLAREVVRLRERVAAAAKAWKFVELNADLCDKGPFGEGWMSKEMGEATSVLAALGWDDE